MAATGSLVVGASLAGCTDGGGNGNGGTPTDGNGGSDGNTTVEMTDDLTYDPKDVTVSSGTTVVWKNVGTVGHSVTAYEEKIPDGAEYFASGGFDSMQAARSNYPSQGEVQGGETYEHTFETAGTYEYFCIPHETAGMKGTVTVEE